MPTKKQKRVSKQLKSAMQRSETVWKNRPGMTEDGHFDITNESGFIRDVGVPDPQHVITLTNKDIPKASGVKTVCTCGWAYGPNTSVLEVGKEAARHSTITGHQFRQHENG